MTRFRSGCQLFEEYPDPESTGFAGWFYNAMGAVMAILYADGRLLVPAVRYV